MRSFGFVRVIAAVAAVGLTISACGADDNDASDQVTRTDDSATGGPGQVQENVVDIEMVEGALQQHDRVGRPALVHGQAGRVVREELRRETLRVIPRDLPGQITQGHQPVDTLGSHRPDLLVELPGRIAEFEHVAENRDPSAVARRPRNLELAALGTQCDRHPPSCGSTGPF